MAFALSVELGGTTIGPSFPDYRATGLTAGTGAAVLRRSAELRHGLRAHASYGCGAVGTGSRLAPEPRAATDTEPRVQRLVFLPILSRRPDEQATYKNGGQEDH